MSKLCPVCDLRVSICGRWDCPNAHAKALAGEANSPQRRDPLGTLREVRDPKDSGCVHGIALDRYCAKCEGKASGTTSRDPLLDARGGTHGDFMENGKIMQALKQLMRDHWKWKELPAEQREALEMIQHKIGRILCGDNNYFDHWLDIAGYAKLIEEKLSEKNK